jgi:MerR family glutamine synthetase transcriptional repressor
MPVLEGGVAMAEGGTGMPVYPIGVVEKLTGLTGRQIRYYEATGLVIPARTKGKQRLYSPEDVERLLRVKELLSQGLNIEGVRAVLGKLPLDKEPSAQDRVETGVVARPAGTGDRTEDESEEKAGLDELAVFAAGELGGVPSREALAAGRRLSSLYPVTNQAELTRILQERETRSDVTKGRSKGNKSTQGNGE